MDTNAAQPSTVGEILTEEFLVPLELDIKFLAIQTSIQANLLKKIINGECQLNDKEATLLAEYFGLSDDFWKNIRDAHCRWMDRSKF